MWFKTSQVVTSTGATAGTASAPAAGTATTANWAKPIYNVSTVASTNIPIADPGIFVYPGVNYMAKLTICPSTSGIACTSTPVYT
jgi:hypothetical protein